MKSQSQAVQRLAMQLRRTYRRTRSWRKTAQKHHVLTPYGQVNHGLAMRIANQGYMPSSRTIKRLQYDGAIEPLRPKKQRKPPSMQIIELVSLLRVIEAVKRVRPDLARRRIQLTVPEFEAVMHMLEPEQPIDRRITRAMVKAGILKVPS